MRRLFLFVLVVSMLVSVAPALAAPVLQSQVNLGDLAISDFMAVNRTTHRLYIADRVHDSVIVYNTSTKAVVGTIAVGDYPQGIAINEATNTIYVANLGSQSISIVNGATGVVTGTLSGLDYQPMALALNPTTNKLYVTNFYNGHVTAIDLTNSTYSAPIITGGNPWDTAVDAVNNKIYIMNYGGGTISVIDGSTDTVGSTLAVGSEPTQIELNQADGKLYVYLRYSYAVDVWTLSTATKTATISGLGIDAESMAFNDVTDRLYLGGNGTLRTVDMTTQAVEGSILNHSGDLTLLSVDPALKGIYGYSGADYNLYAFQDGELAEPGPVVSTPASAVWSLGMLACLGVAGLVLTRKQRMRS